MFNKDSHIIFIGTTAKPDLLHSIFPSLQMQNFTFLPVKFCPIHFRPLFKPI